MKYTLNRTNSSEHESMWHRHSLVARLIGFWTFVYIVLSNPLAKYIINTGITVIRPQTVIH